jgi:hypothetical protein
LICHAVEKNASIVYKTKKAEMLKGANEASGANPKNLLHLDKQPVKLRKKMFSFFTQFVM